MKNYYNDFILEFYIEVVEKVIDDYENKINMLKDWVHDMSEELISRGDD